MEIWRRIYKKHGYSVVVEDLNKYILETYNDYEITDVEGVKHKVVNSLVDKDEFVIVVE